MVTVSNRTAIVTGAGNPQGIGFAIAKALLAGGANVMICATTARIADRANELAAAGADCARIGTFVGDLSEPQVAEELAAACVATFGGIDIVVNNAGMQQTGVESAWPSVEDLTPEIWARTLSLSLMTSAHVTRACIGALKRSPTGRIVNMSSVSGPVAIFEGGGAYAAAKAALVGYTRSLALELGPFGVTANAICPGWIDNGGGHPTIEIGGRNTPIGRTGRPGEVASLARYLASDEAGYLTGQMIVIDGGNTIQEFKSA